MLGTKMHQRRHLPKHQLRSIQAEGERRLAKAVEAARAKMSQQVVDASGQSLAETVRPSFPTLAAPRIKEFEAFLSRISHKTDRS